jgi:acyl-CoA reductase-like NAD-dependent aldehyde dehydrogenase
MAPDNDEALVLPLWINGHVYLTMVESFFNVTNPKTGEVLRRTPLCGLDAATKAVAVARAALPQWGLCSEDERKSPLLKIADALEGYAAHFAALIVAETGKDASGAAAEVAQAVSLLRAASAQSQLAGSVLVAINDDTMPLFGLLSIAVPALLAGAVIVAKPSPKAPSAAFAFAELTARAGLPDGVFNIVQGDIEAIEGLCASPAVSILLFAGDAALGARVGEIATRHGKLFVA